MYLYLMLLLVGTYIVDLSCNQLHCFSGRLIEPLSANAVESLVKALPFGPRLRLQNKLFSVAVEYRIGPQTEGE